MSKFITDSVWFAKHFKKSHTSVIVKIATSQCSEEFKSENYKLDEYTSSRNRTYTRYLITRDGLTMLVMGMKGKEFSEFKMKMLNDFNSLESSLGLKLDLTGRK